MGSFSGTKVLLELGAHVADVEALLADSVVSVKTEQHGVARRVNLLPGLREGTQTNVCFC